ncbi:MAG: hypothetical protein ACJ72W_06895 [Actinoallomurus sp.]
MTETAVESESVGQAAGLPSSAVSDEQLIATLVHASLTPAGGADLSIVRERLGYAGLRADERHLHALHDADDAALAALAGTRTGARRAAAPWRLPLRGESGGQSTGEHGRVSYRAVIVQPGVRRPGACASQQSCLR